MTSWLLKPNFLTSMGYHTFLTMVLRAPKARAELRYYEYITPVKRKGGGVGVLHAHSGEKSHCLTDLPGR